MSVKRFLISAMFFSVTSLMATTSGTCTTSLLSCTVDADCPAYPAETCSSSNTPPVASNVVITGTLEEGQTLSVTYDYNDTENDPEFGTTFKWFSADDDMGTNSVQVSGGTWGSLSPEYVLQASDVGKYMQVYVYPNDGQGAGAGVPSSFEGPVDVLPDTTSPQVASIIRQTPSVSPTDADTLIFRVAFDENVTNIDTADFTVTGTSATVSGVTNAGGNSYDVTISGGDLATLNGTVTLYFSAAQDIEDAAANPLINTTPTGTNDNTYEVQNITPTVNNKPIITSTPVTEVTAGTLYSYTITATDSDGDTINFRMIDGPAWLSLTGTGAGTANLYGTTPTSETDFTVKIVANDGTEDSDIQTFTVVVKSVPIDGGGVENTNHAPVISSSPVESLTMTVNRFHRDDDGTETVFDITTGLTWQDDNESNKMEGMTWYDANDYCEALSLGGADDWRQATKDELVSLITGTYRNTSAKGEPSNGFIYLSQIAYIWTSTTFGADFNVSAIEKTGAYVISPILNSVLPGLFDQNFSALCTREGVLQSVQITDNAAEYSYTLAATDEDGDTLTYKAVKIPGWLTFDENTHELHGIPSYNDIPGDNNVTLSVSDGTETVYQSFSITLEPKVIETGASGGASCSCNYSPDQKNVDLMFILLVMLGILYPVRKRFVGRT